MRLRRAICFLAIMPAPFHALASSMERLEASSATPSIITLPQTPANEITSIVSIDDAHAVSGGAVGDITVIRGGDVGGPLPPAEPEAQPAAQPMLNPEDRGTPAKRKALKRQAERLEQEEAVRRGAQPSP